MGWNGSDKPAKETAEVPRRPSPRRRTSALAVALAVLVAAIAAAFVFRRTPSRTPSSASAEPAAGESAVRGSDAPSVKGAPTRPRATPRAASSASPAASPDADGELTPSETLQAALAAEDFAAVRRTAAVVLASTNAEERVDAVEALGWFGAQALPQLTAAMADRDEDVRQAAESAWVQALQEVEPAAERFDLAVAPFGSLRDEDALEVIGLQLSAAAAEMIEGEEDSAAAAANRRKVLLALVGVIDRGAAPNVAAGISVYREITGHEWRGIAETERYLADPENYEAADPASSPSSP